MHDRLVHIDRIRQRFAQQPCDERHGDGCLGRGLFFGGIEPLLELVVFRLPAGAARGDGGGIGLLACAALQSEGGE